MGIAFVAFKDKDCVWETLDEMDLVKQRLAEDQRIKDLGLLDWQVAEAYAPNDIDWNTLNMQKSNDVSCSCFLMVMVRLMSFLFILSLVYLDQDGFDS